MSVQREVGLFEAKTHLSELVSEGEGGASITLTRRGKPVARLVAIADNRKAQRREAIRQTLALRAELAANGQRFTREEILSARDEGRR